MMIDHSFLPFSPFADKQWEEMEASGSAASLLLHATFTRPLEERDLTARVWW